MKKRISGLLLALALMAFAPATAAAAEVNTSPNVITQQCTTGPDRGGAAALAALVAAAAAVDADVVVCDVLNNSLNNLLQNADIHVLENILNNSPILSDITIEDIEVLEDGIVISVLGGPVINLR